MEKRGRIDGLLTRMYELIRLFFGKTKVMAKALGTTVEEEYQPNLSQLAGVRLASSFWA